MPTPAERLKKARIDAGYANAKEAADALGVNYSTYGQHENGTRGFPAHKAERYARKFKVPLEYLLTGKVMNGGIGTLHVDKNHDGKIDLVQVIGIVKAGLWQDVDDFAGEHMAEWVPSSSEYPSEWQYAFVVDGSSINKTAKHGDRLICVDLDKSGARFEDGDLVIVERTRYNGQMIERTAKRARRVVSGWELWPESDDPKFQTPVAYKTAGETDEVRVTAKVIWVLRKP